MRKLFSAVIAILLLFSCAQAAISFQADNAFYLLDRTGSAVIPAGAYSEIIPLGNDLFAAMQDGLYALINCEGVRYTEFIYDEMQPADSGCILIRKDQLWGVLRSNGSVLHKCAYSNIIPSGNGAFWAFSGSRNDLHADPLLMLYADGRIIGTDNRVLDAATTAESGLLRALIPEQNQYGYIDVSGKIAIAAQFDYAGCFINGIAAIVLNGKYGIIDTDGNYVLEPEFTFTGISSSGLILAMRDDGYAALYSRSGALIAQKRARYATLCGKYAFIADDTAASVFGVNGEIISTLSPNATVQAGIDSDLILSEGAWGETCVYLFGTAQKYQNIYPLGTANQKPVYAYMTIHTARYTNDILGEIQYSTDPSSARYGLIDGDGRILLNAEYLSIEYLEDNRFRVRTEDQWQMIDSGGKIYFSCAATDEESSSE